VAARARPEQSVLAVLTSNTYLMDKVIILERPNTHFIDKYLELLFKATQ